MGLTAEDELSLRNAKLVQFYNANKSAFKTIAKRAHKYAHDRLEETGLPVRLDDVAISLIEALRTNQKLRENLAAKKLNQKFWYSRFADLILDRLWDELEAEHQSTTEET